MRQRKEKEIVFIIGVGLIGGSLALALQASRDDVLILGYSDSKEANENAAERGLIHESVSTLEMGAVLADLIIICTPVSVTLALLKELSYLTLKDNVVITDVSSTKKLVVDLATTVFDGKKVQFIGGHPMAGSHKSGHVAADKHLFENAYYILTPTNDVQPKALSYLKGLLESTRANIVELEPNEHDALTGMLSHLPHIIASGLVNQADAFVDDYPNGLQLAAGGFRDMTRIASSNPRMWTDILLTNRETLLTLLTDYECLLQELKLAIELDDEATIFNYFSKAKHIRDGLPTAKKGAIAGFYDVFVTVPDYPGAIATVTKVLGEEQISLINLKILETREDIHGVLQLSFKRDEDATLAFNVIKERTMFECNR